MSETNKMDNEENIFPAPAANANIITHQKV